MKYRVLAAAALLAIGCGRDKPAEQSAINSPDGSMDGASQEAPSVVLPPECANATMPPSSLVCTGLYADIVAKVLAPDVEAYSPAVPLWSDGAEKQRWIRLPAGSVIDNTDPNEWRFPIGTQLWKEFSRGGGRVETRMWQKLSATYWVNAAYAWNADESAATSSKGGDITLGDGSTYHIPTNDECQKCHRGRTDFILGFEQINLGLDGATGLTLAQLMANGQLSSPPASTSMVIGDDGTGVAAPALGWLHTNCGVTCHNPNSNATAYQAGMHLRLDATQMDGRSSAGFEPLLTTVGVMVNDPDWKGQTRIVPGDPTNSLLFHLITNRGTGNQMPPIATSIVDMAHTPLVQAWIAAMPPAAPPPPPDAGSAPGDDAGTVDETGGGGDDTGAGDDAGANDDASVTDDASTTDDAATPDDAGDIDDALDIIDAVVDEVSPASGP
ncbi:MAG TPA: hypothetical protein VGL59_16040 [Polyangia bacterium]|jgi:hypothetical protein